MLETAEDMAKMRQLYNNLSQITSIRWEYGRTVHKMFRMMDIRERRTLANIGKVEFSMMGDRQVATRV